MLKKTMCQNILLNSGYDNKVLGLYHVNINSILEHHKRIFVKKNKHNLNLLCDMMNLSILFIFIILLDYVITFQKSLIL